MDPLDTVRALQNPQPVPGTVSPEDSAAMLRALVPDYLKPPEFDNKMVLPPYGKVPSVQPKTLMEMAPPAALDLAGALPVKAAAVVGAGLAKAGAKAAEEVAPPFYSALQRAVEGAKMEKGTLAQWMGYLKNQPGVKAEELGRLGDLGEGQITKQQMTTHAQESGVPLKEVWKGVDASPEAIKQRALFEARQDVRNELSDRYLPEQLNSPEFQERINHEAQQRLDDYDEHPYFERAEDYLNAGGKGTKFHDYQLPGGENYRELLMTMPEQTAKPKSLSTAGWKVEQIAENPGTGQRHIAVKDETGRVLGQRSGFRGTDEEAIKDMATSYSKMASEDGSKKLNFRSSHWDEPNVLVHARMNDRMIPDPAGTHDSVVKVPRDFKSDDLELMRQHQEPHPDLTPADSARFKELENKYYSQGSLIPKEDRERYDLRSKIGEWVFRKKGDDTGGYSGRGLNEEEARNDAAEFLTAYSQKPTEDVVGPKALKSLHLEEIQSDWHQKGRKQGYQGSDRLNPDEMKELATLTDRTKVPNPTDAQLERSTELDKRRRASINGVPDAPFKQTWPDLALKRTIREAAEKGYDAVSWTPGEAQAARYDLSKQVTAIRANRNPDGTYQIGVQPIGRNMIPHDTAVPEDKLADLVGKELAEKISKQEGVGVDKGKVYSGLDLKVGGEGMKAFYDKMLVDKANALGKKHGAKVESSAVPVTEGDSIQLAAKAGMNQRQWEALTPEQRMVEMEKMKQPVHMMRITPELRAAAMKGFPLFSAGAVATPDIYQTLKEGPPQ